MAFKSINELNTFIKVIEDSVEHDCNRDIVYCIKCANCDASYVGQTKRKLKTRISERTK